MTSIWVPFAYITVLVGGMLMFSRYLRRQKQAKISATEPWFPTHQARDLYITLLQADPPTHEKILMSALLCRAVTDVKRIWQLRDSKQALNILVQKGSLGDETVTRFAAAEKELEAEVVDVVAEANTFKQGWGQWIFASASEIAQREKLKGVLEEMPKIKQEQDRIYASIKAKQQSSAPPPSPYSATAPAIGQTPPVPAGQAVTSALESSTEGLVNRAAGSIGTDKEGEEISSGASTPQKSGVTSGKNTPGSAKKKGKRK
ncbi:Translocation protein S66 [Naganishia albida]|nr:Translocation protein S66 [Naganishia albida]